MTNFDDKIAAAEAAAAKALTRAARMRTIQLAEAEIPGIWDTGQVSQTSLAKTYGISPVTVKRILRDAGRTVTRVKKLSHDERAEAGALIRQNVPIDAIAAQFQVSKNTIRRTGLDLGILTKGERRPRRTDAEYQVIKAFDDDVRMRFGTSMYNLGLGLRTWEAKKRAEARAQSGYVAANDGYPQDSPPNDAPAVWPAPETPVRTWVPNGQPSEPQPVDGDGDLDTLPPIFEEPVPHDGEDTPAPQPAPFTNI